MDQSLRVERVVLLGMVTLLGATGDLATALAALVISAAAALVVYAAWALLRLSVSIPAAARWGALIAIGFAVSWALASVAPYLVPIRDGAMLFLRIAGLMPIVYYAAGDGASGRDVLVSWAQFAVLVAGAGAVREFFGRGTLLGYLPGGSFTIRAGFLASPVGAFLLIATVVLAARIVSSALGTSNEAAGGTDE